MGLYVCLITYGWPIYSFIADPMHIWNPNMDIISSTLFRHLMLPGYGQKEIFFTYQWFVLSCVVVIWRHCSKCLMISRGIVRNFGVKYHPTKLFIIFTSHPRLQDIRGDINNKDIEWHQEWYRTVKSLFVRKKGMSTDNNKTVLAHIELTTW